MGMTQTKDFEGAAGIGLSVSSFGALALNMLRHAVGLSRSVGVSRTEAENLVDEVYKGELPDARAAVGRIRRELSRLSVAAGLQSDGAIIKSDLPPRVVRLIDAASAISPHHEEGDSMAISSFHIRELWDALNKLEAVLKAR